MSIVTSEVRHFACVWYVPGPGFDFMGVLYQKHDACWEMKYRFRYYSEVGDGDPHGDDDFKSWYVVRFDKGRKVPEMEVAMDDVIEGVFGARRRDVEKVEVRGDARKFAEVMSQQKWVHLKWEPKEGSVPS